MPSTFSPSLRIELIANGEQSGTWGATTNNNMGTLIEQAITGVGSISLYGGDYTLTNYNGLPDESRNAVLTFSGSLSAPANVIAPSVQKTYIVTNNSGANVTIKTASGNGVTVQNGLSSLVYCDGTDFYTAVNVNNVIGDLSVSGNETVAGSLTLGGNITLANTVTAGNLAMTANSGIVTMAGNTGAFTPPTGTTAQRPGSPVVGMSRWNTDLGVYEIYNGNNWQIIASGSYTGSYLAVAGGGGSVGTGGGGGAGGYLTGSINFTSGTTYTITVGAGGGASNGTNSLIVGVVSAVGGGRSGYGSSPSTVVGGTGGSGGGGQPGTDNACPGGAGTAGQGNSGGAGNGSNVGGAGGGGGGGAGAAGGNQPGGDGTTGGNGGAGLASSITGVSTYYAGGGGGGGATPGSGGAGGGGTGNGTSGTANTGGGAGGGGSGGSGVVILSIPTVSYTGVTTGSPTVTINGSNTVVKFTSSGTYTA